MQSNGIPTPGSRLLTLPVRLFLLFIIWLVFISSFHYRLNNRSNSQEIVRMGYMPVVTNLAAPLLDYVSRDIESVHFKALKFSSFAEMAEALRNGNIQAAFVIAPLAIVLRQQGVDVKVVMIGNRHESTLVARKSLKAKRLEDLVGCTIAVPMRYSGHNLCLLRMIDEKNLNGRIRIVEMNPPDMASALTAGALDAYFVGEPFAAQTVLSGDATVVARVENMWPNFICNLVLVENGWLKTHPALAQKLVETAARSGLWAGQNPEEAARIASDYWNQSVDLVLHAITDPPGRVVYDRFVPVSSELQEMADLMVRFNLIEHADITGLVDAHLAETASITGIDDLNSIASPE